MQSVGGRGDVAAHSYKVQKVHDKMSCGIKTVKLLEKWSQLTSIFLILPIIGGGKGPEVTDQEKCGWKMRCGQS